MKNHEIQNNELELIFNRIIEQTPLIAEEQVIFLLQNPIKTPPTNPFLNFVKTHLNALIIAAVVICAVPLAIFLATSDEIKTKTTVTERPVHEETQASAPGNTPSIQSPIAKIDSVNKKEVKTIAPVRKISEEIHSGHAISVADIYKPFEKKLQLFSIRPDRDTVISGKEGTVFRIKANSFVSEKTSQVVTGKIQLALKEYYKLPDMLMARLSTNSDGKIIETGGMIYISATSGNENCVLKQGEKIEISFPYTKKKADMILFSGSWGNDQINWKTEANTTSENSVPDAVLMRSPDENRVDEVFMVVEEMPEFPGGNTPLRQYIQENTRYPYSALKNKLEGRVYVNFVVDRSGNVRNIRIARGFGNALDKSAAWLVSRMPFWKPGVQRGKPVNVSYTIPVTFRINDSDTTAEGIRQAKLFEKQLSEINYDETSKSLITNNKSFAQKFEKKLNDGNLQKSDIFAANGYILDAYKLGWINCDRFVSFTNPKTNLSILLDNPRNSIVSVIFQQMNAILQGQVENDRISFKNVPLGEKITIVALKTTGDKIYLAVEEKVITENGEIKPDFQPITPDLLKTEMGKLHFNE